MAAMTELAAAVDSRDPATGLAAVAARRRLLDEAEALLRTGGPADKMMQYAW